MLPKELVARFWINVRRLLENEHGLGAELAFQGIADYRRALAEHDAHEWAYHDGESRTADIIAGLVRPTPPSEASESNRATGVDAGREGRQTTCHYSMVIRWSDEDQVYVVILPEFGPYCKTHGSTYEEAAKNGREVLKMLMETYRAEGQPLPEPVKLRSPVSIGS